MDNLAEEITALKQRIDFLEQEFGGQRATVEDSFNQRLGVISESIESLSKQVEELTAEVRTHHLHASDVAGDLANRVMALES